MAHKKKSKSKKSYFDDRKSPYKMFGIKNVGKEIGTASGKRIKERG